MSLVAVRIELPAYSHSFTVVVPETSTVRDVKQAIFATCVGHPQSEGQRIIWRGRYLFDEEKVTDLWSVSNLRRGVFLQV